MSEQGPKSAIELAMERLRQKDAVAGVAPVALSDEQKAAIAEIRSLYQSKLAYAELMHASALAGLGRHGDPAAREAMDEQYRRERERFVSERESKIEKIRRGEA
jgi:HEAT repeat protein